MRKYNSTKEHYHVASSRFQHSNRGPNALSNFRERVHDHNASSNLRLAKPIRQNQANDL